MHRHIKSVAPLFFFIIAAALHAQPKFGKATVLMTGNVTDASSRAAIKAELSFRDESGKELTRAKSNLQGKYTAVLKPGVTYTVRGKWPGYYSKDESLPVEASETYKEASHDFSLDKIVTGRVLFSAVAFDRGSTTLLSDAMSPIEQAGATLALNEEIRATIETWADDAIVPANWPPSDQAARRGAAIRDAMIASSAATGQIKIVTHEAPPAPPPPAVEPKGKKKKKAAPKPKPPKKGKKGATAQAASPTGSKATVTIMGVVLDED